MNPNDAVYLWKDWEDTGNVAVASMDGNSSMTPPLTTTLNTPKTVPNSMHSITKLKTTPNYPPNSPSSIKDCGTSNLVPSKTMTKPKEREIFCCYSSG